MKFNSIRFVVILMASFITTSCIQSDGEKPVDINNEEVTA